jgi:hypothetical protein
MYDSSYYSDVCILNGIGGFSMGRFTYLCKDINIKEITISQHSPVKHYHFGSCSVGVMEQQKPSVEIDIKLVSNVVSTTEFSDIKQSREYIVDLINKNFTTDELLKLLYKKIKEE